jgi:hypothetical protein
MVNITNKTSNSSDMWASDMQLNANPAIFQLYHGENKLIVNEMMTRSALYYTNTLRVGF